MYIIFKVAQAELRNLFYSPIAWLMMLVFFVLCGYQFVTPIESFSRIQSVMQDSDPKWFGFEVGLSWDLFASSYNQMVEKLYLFIPLLTMGIINREMQSGSIKLLYSSPIRTRDIVLGKYLALVIFNCLLVLCVGVFLFTGYFSIINPEWKWFLSAMLAIFLLANTYSAIGLFISALTSYQIVAGVITFVVFFVLYAIQSLWQQYDFVRDLTWFLSISGRTSSMLYGLITTRDLAYFVLIIALFLAFSLIKMKSTQESKHWRVSFLRYMGCFLAVLMLGYFSSRPGYVGYLDITKRKLNTLHPATQEVIKELDGSPLTVTLYTNLLGKNIRAGVPENRNSYIWHFWDRVVRFYPDIKLKYEYYYDVKDGDSSMMKYFRVSTLDSAAEKFSELTGVDKSIFQKPEEIRKKIDLSGEDYGLVMQVEYKGKKAWLRTFPDPEVWPSENHISGTIRRLTRDAVPEVLFTTGHYERSPFKNGEREFGGHAAVLNTRLSLINKGVNIDTVSLRDHDIPAKTTILVLADPRSALDTMEQHKVINWLEKGGDAVFYAEPGKQEMLNPVLQTIGVSAEQGTIVTLNKHELPNMLNGLITDSGTYLAKEEPLYRLQIIGKGRESINNVGVTELSYKPVNGFKIEPILYVESAKNRWLEKGHLVVDSAAPIYSPEEGDIKRDNYITGIKMYRTVNGREQRIIVTGDADFMSNIRASGGSLFNAGYSWIMRNEYPVYHPVPYPKDNLMTVSKQTGKLLKPVFIYIIPSIILLAGIILLIRRKRK